MISIIIPLYNLGCSGDNCLIRCLDSIKKQSYNDYEVLLMENGSTDDTVEIANRYVSTDDRFKLFILDEKGISNARNKGIENSTGEYITFIDGDDYISENYLESMVKEMEKNSEIDLVVTQCSMHYIKNNKFKLLPTDYTPRILDKDSIIEIYQDGTIWAKLYKSSIIKDNKIYLRKDLFGVDDTLFIAEYRILTNKASIINNSTYFYIQGRQGQTSANKYNEMADGILKLYELLKEVFNKHNVYDKYSGYIHQQLINFFIGKDFATTFILKLDKKKVVGIINKYKKELNSIVPDATYSTDWQIKWFRLFKYFMNINLGYPFLRYMKIYRNSVLNTFGIKRKGKVVKCVRVKLLSISALKKHDVF